MAHVLILISKHRYIAHHTSIIRSDEKKNRLVSAKRLFLQSSTSDTISSVCKSAAAQPNLPKMKIPLILLGNCTSAIVIGFYN